MADYRKPYGKDNFQERSQTTISKIELDYIKNPNLFDETAKKIASEISKTKSTQIRNFYDYVLELYEDAKNKPFNEVLPFVKMLNSKVAYSLTRKHASPEFALMIQECVKQVNDVKKLEIFKLFFEAVIGFSKTK
ncbi:MAG: type III-A CRISPR-associated protein Csm2 [Arcobacteraceae bacterium]|nr:type III-A CRISPR-associated protein Csm2 [Arcobacteraceae bacterium]